MKMLIITISSSQSPANADNSAIPKASPPTDKVPNPLLNHLLRVAPAGGHYVYIVDPVDWKAWKLDSPQKKVYDETMDI